MEWTLRVLQAADLSLHEPLETAGRLPATFREVFNQARERTALKVFNTAIEQRADLLLLTGFLADFQAEPRLACFLMEQFRRLHAAGVNVVWTTDKSALLPIWSLRPEHVTCLLPGQSAVLFTMQASRQILVHHALQEVSPSRIADDLHTSTRDLVITVSTHSAFHCIEYRGKPAGQDHQAIQHGIVPVQLAGPSDQRTHGMRITEFASDVSPQTRLAPVAAVEWMTQTIDLSEFSTRAALLQTVSQRIHQLRQSTTSDALCLDWVFTGAGELWNELLLDVPADQILQDIRTCAARNAHIWSWKVHLEPAPEQYRIWSESPALAEGLRQLEQLSTADLAASANIPSPAGTFLRGPVMTQHEFNSQRVRLVRELRSPITFSKAATETINRNP